MIYQFIGRIVVWFGLRAVRRKIRANPAKAAALVVVALVIAAGIAAARSDEA